MNTLTHNPPMLDAKYNDTVILLGDLEFGMTKEQLKKITELNNQGKSVYEISTEVKRNTYEVIIAILHQAKTGKVPIGPIWGFR